MDDSPLIDKVPKDHCSFLNTKEKVSRFINVARRWDLKDLIGLLPDEIIKY